MLEIERLIVVNPNLSIIKQRIFVEEIVRQIINSNKVNVLDKGLKGKIHFLYDNGLIKENWYDVFENIRIFGNKAVHESYGDLTSAKTLYQKLVDISLEISELISTRDEGLNYNLDSVKVEVNDLKNKDIMKFHIDLLSGGFKYDYTSEVISDEKNLNLLYKKSMFETDEEYAERIEKLGEVNIGIAQIISFLENVDYPILVQLDSSQGIYFPTIDGFFINNVFNIRSGNYKIISKLKVYNGRICIDINHIFMLYGNKKLPVKLLITKKQEGFTSDLHSSFEIIVGDIKFDNNAYDIKKERLRFKLNTIKSLSRFITESSHGFIYVDRDRAKYIYESEERCFLKADIELRNFEVHLKGLYLLNGMDKYPILLEDNHIKNDLIAVKHEYRWGVVDKKGKYVIEPKYYEINRFSNGMARVSLDNLYGFIDEEGKEVIPAVYETAGDFKDDFTYVIENEEYYHINKQNKPLTKGQYENVTIFSEGYAGVKHNGLWGYISKSGNLVISCKYDTVSLFKSNVAIVEMNGRYGVINKENEIIIDFIYDRCICDYFNNIIVVENGFYGYYSLNGEEKLPVKYEEISALGEDVFFVKEHQQYKIISDIEIKINGIEDATVYPSSRVIVIRKDYKYGMINYQGREILECKYDYIYERKNNTFLVSLNGKCGIIDGSGKIAIPLIFDSIDESGSGLSAAQLDGRYGYINEAGDVMIPFKFDYAGRFIKGMAPVCINYKWGVIDEYGKIIIECKFQRVSII